MEYNILLFSKTYFFTFFLIFSYFFALKIGV